MVKKILSSPITLFVCIILGVLTGSFVPEVAETLTPFGDIYTSILTISSIPILVCAITLSVSKIANKKCSALIFKFLGGSLALLVIASVIGVVVSLSMQNVMTPNDSAKIELLKLNQSADSYISDSFQDLEFYGENGSNESEANPVMVLINDAIPENIFHALGHAEVLQIIVFFFILGLMLNFIDKKYSVPIIKVFQGIYSAMQIFIRVIIIPMPVYLFIMMAKVFSNKNMVHIIPSLGWYLLAIILGMFLLSLVAFIVVRIRMGISFVDQAKAMKNTFFIAFSTTSKTSTLPFALEDSINNLGLDPNVTQVSLPLGSTLIPSGMLMCTIILTFFALALYGKSINVSTIIIVVIASFAFCMSTINIDGSVASTMLYIAFNPLGLPSDVMSFVRLSTFMLYAGISTFVAMYANVAVTCLLCPKVSKKHEHKWQKPYVHKNSNKKTLVSLSE